MQLWPQLRVGPGAFDVACRVDAELSLSWRELSPGGDEMESIFVLLL